MTDSRVLILGGHGKVALLLAPLLVARGDEVTAVIRNPAHADDVSATGATPLVLDLEAGADLGEAFEGYDAIVWAAGAGGGSRERTYAVDRDAAIRSMDAAEAARVRRYVMVSWIGSSPDHGVDPDNPFYAYADAKLAADDHLRASTLNWTILGPGALTLDPPTGRIALDPEGDGAVPRADVAAVIAAALAEDHTVGRFIRFGSGDTPIAEALAR
ncbi:SDR family oxidoreductase [Microbacterium sp. dk485]|uniref:SDR family oxidoreductase n=1 Tax=Microbacterium sp. dk485 TaxID=2560021 RepID=UPI0010740B81|nr:SDR family oxidoreductase [Microbacterium sp. dk485]TFV82449.1 SDR family oxidoreductase [Microbacterium sp. dk485]